MIKEQLPLFLRLSSALLVINSDNLAKKPIFFSVLFSMPNGKVTGVTKSHVYKISLDSRDESSIRSTRLIFLMQHLHQVNHSCLLSLFFYWVSSILFQELLGFLVKLQSYTGLCLNHLSMCLKGAVCQSEVEMPKHKSLAYSP